MILEENTITSKSALSDDKTKRYSLEISWNSTKEKLCIIMLSAGNSNGIYNDKTTNLVVKNVFETGYGSVSILNLFPDVDGSKNTEKDEENLSAIENSAKGASTVVFAVGTAHRTNKGIAKRQKEVLNILKKYEKKLFCISDDEGKKFYHPLCPKASKWNLVSVKVKELCEDD